MAPSVKDYLEAGELMLDREEHARLVQEYKAKGIQIVVADLGRHETTAVEEDAGYDVEFRDHDSTGPPIMHTFVDPNAPDAPSRVGAWEVADVFGVDNSVDKGPRFGPDPGWLSECYKKMGEDDPWDPARRPPHGRRVLLRGVPREACILAIGPPKKWPPQ